MKKYAFTMLLIVLLLITTPLVADGLLSSNEALKLQINEIKIGIQEVSFNIESIYFDSNIGFITAVDRLEYNIIIANRSENGYINRYSSLRDKLRGDYLHFARHSTELLTATHNI